MKVCSLAAALLIFLFGHGILAQDRADSLLNILSHYQQRDSIKANVLNQLAYEFYLSDPARALRLASQAKTLSDSIGYSKGVAQAFRQMGLVSWTQSNLATALTYFYKGLKLAESVNDKQGIADITGNLGLVYTAMGDYKQAKDLHTRSLAMQRQLKNTVRQSVAFNNLGDVCRFQKEYERAIQYYKHALDLRTKANYKSGQATNIRNIGNVYEEMGLYDSALLYYQNSFRVATEISDRRGICQCKNAMASVYLKKGKYYESKQNALASLAISLKEKYRSFARDSYETLYKINELQHDEKQAFQYFKLYTAYRDSVQNLEVASEIAYQQLEYETQKKQNEIDLLTRDAMFNQVAIEKKNWLLILVSLLLAFGVLFFLVLFKNYSHQRLVNNLLKERNTKIELQRKEIIEQRDELMALNEEITAQQEEVMASHDALAEKNTEIAEMHKQVLEMNQNLEKLVAIRTASLEKQKAQLIEYAFINAHKLRAPLASILGLVNLLTLDIPEMDEKEIVKYLKESSEKLDRVVRSINETLQKGLDIYRDDENININE